MTRALLLALLAAFVATGVAACGRAGLPQVPSGQQDTLRRKYPPPENGDQYPGMPSPPPTATPPNYPSPATGGEHPSQLP